MKTMMTLLAGFALAGYAGTNDVVSQAQKGCADCQEIGIRSLLGVNDDILSDTNRFPRCNVSRNHTIPLGGTFGGFTNAVVTIYEDWNSGKLSLECVKFTKTLERGTDDSALIEEFRKAVSLVNELLECRRECPGLKEPAGDDMRMYKWAVGSITTCVDFDLANKQQVMVKAEEATYVIRSGKPIQTRPGRIEVVFEFPVGPRAVRQEERVKVKKDLTIGPDCTETLSRLMKSGRQVKGIKSDMVAERAEQRQQLMAIRDELRKVHEIRNKELKGR